MENVNEIIKVGAVFKGSNILPKWFVWKNRKYAIKEVNYNWKDKQGVEDLHCFSVTDGANSFEISFNAKRVIWVLNKILGEV